jgi:hypothetical protein
MKTSGAMVILSYPPASSVWHLPMGIAYLAAIAQQHGHDVIQEYGYIKGVEYVLREHGARTLSDTSAQSVIQTAPFSIGTMPALVRSRVAQVRLDREFCRGAQQRTV